jgi:hypothetical protein
LKIQKEKLQERNSPNLCISFHQPLILCKQGDRLNKLSSTLQLIKLFFEIIL